jgi:hypothetical protein
MAHGAKALVGRARELGELGRGHHQTNVHAYNYGNLAIWDIVFGTFKNPESFEGRVGFAEKASFAKMLIGRDVSGGLGDGIDRRTSEMSGEEVAA